MPLIVAAASLIPGSDALLAVGVTLVVLGVVLRGFHQSNQRTQSQRTLTERFSRVAGQPETPGIAAASPPRLVRHLPLLYRSMFLLGVAMTLAGLLRR